jgi:CO/xanthine dehydrogenase Mo-binding subunit
MKPTLIPQTGMEPENFPGLEKAGASRRDFLRTAGVMFIGFTMAEQTGKLAAQNPTNPTGLVDANQVDSWLAIGADDSITAYTGKIDFGQGFATVQYQLVAEELGVPLSRIRLIMGDTGTTPDQGVTSGSQSHIAEFGPGGLRQALDTARDALMQLASQQLDVPQNQLVVKGGVVYMKSDPTRWVSYGQLVQGRRFNLTLNTKTVPKDPRQYTVLGTSVRRFDIPPKTTGEFQYVQHVRLPGMLHGKVVRPPVIGATVVSVNKGSIAGMPGNPQVVVKKDFVGVVADSQWHAINAAAALDVTWSKGAALPVFDQLYDWMRKQPSRDAYTVNSGDVDQNIKNAAKAVSSTYLHPYQMHGSMGSSCAVADVRGGTGANATAKIWSATQGVYPQRDSAALVLGIPAGNVRVIFVEGSGCYGINGADTVCYDAALMSQAVGAPVRVQYSRHDEMAAGENYGPAHVMDMSAGLDKNGQIVAWNYEGWTLTKGGRPNATTPGNIITGALAGFATPGLTPAAATPPTTFSNNGNTAPAYITGAVNGNAGGTGNVASQRVLVHTIESPFFTGPLRSPDRLQNTFANECFMDELAAAVKDDPVQYRLRHLTDNRLIAVIKGAAQRANWDARPSPRTGIPKTGIVTGRGISCVLYEGNNGYSAMVAEVQVDQDSGTINVTRIVAAQDSGPVSNPDGIRNQMEGGAMQGMSRAMHEEVKWSDQAGIITSVDWRTYPVYKYGDVLPVIETVVLDPKNVAQMGAGECQITIVAAAIGNAVFDATGVRMRRVPFTPENFLAARLAG